MAQEYRENQTERIELFSYDPVLVVRDVLKRWYLILAVSLLLGMAAFVGTRAAYQPNYTASATFVVSSRGSSASVYQNLSATNGLASVFSEVLNSSILRAAVLEDLDIPAFTGRIRAEAVAETNLLTLKVTDHDPRTAFLVTRSILENHPVVSYQVLGDTVLEVLQEPAVPMAPDNPLSAGGAMKKGMLLGAAGMCILLGVLSVMRDTVRSRQEAERKLGERVLCEMNHERKIKNLRMLRRKLEECLRLLRVQGPRALPACVQLFRQTMKTSILITNPTTAFAFVEKVRKLRRQVEQRMPADGKVLMVTSVLENEGKTTLAVNLALVLAQKQKKVLLIDGDLRRPACHKVLEQRWSGPGAAAVLRKEARFADAVVHYRKMPQLRLLLESGEYLHSADLISSPEMEALLKTAREQYDYVIIDTPPMAAATDAECLMELADASLLVVRQNRAGAKALNNALDVLHGGTAKFLGCVLNDVCTPVLSQVNSYGGGYGGGYGYGGYGRYGHYGAYGSAHGKLSEAGGGHES